MIVADNAVSLRLLEDLCAEMRARMEPQPVRRPKFLQRIRQLRLFAKAAVRMLAILTSVWLTLN